MAKSEPTRQWKQRQLVPDLKPGDKAYFIYGDWGKPELITITGVCDEGDGYSAWSAKFAADHPDDPEDERGGIHTCNGFLAKTRKEARAESLRIAKELRKEYAERQANCTRAIQYLDWVIVNGGKHAD